MDIEDDYVFAHSVFGPFFWTCEAITNLGRQYTILKLILKKEVYLNFIVFNF